ncbi:MAG: chemotaxis protein CheW [Cyanobacteria bacterium J06633_2]
MSNDLSISEGRSLTSKERSLTVPTVPQIQETPAPDSSASDEQQFLRLKLFSNITALLPLQQLSEVLTIPVGQITPIPSMPSWVMGIYNLRGEVLWIADLSNFLGLVSWNDQPTSVIDYTTVVLNMDTIDDSPSFDNPQMIGLIVNQTEETERCNLKDIQSSIASSVSPKLARFLQGYWLNPKGEMLAVLDGNAMLNAMANR